MPEIFFARSLLYPSDIVGDDPHARDAFCSANGLGLGDRIPPGNAYSFDYEHNQTLAIVRRFNTMPRPDRLSVAHSADTMGEETHSLVKLYEEQFSSERIKLVNGLISAGSGVADARLTQFQSTLRSYQEALLEANRLTNARGPGVGAQRLQAQSRVHTAYNNVMNRYSVELNLVSSEAFRYKNRGNALSNAERGMNLATRHPNRAPDPRLYVADSVHAGRVGSFAKWANRSGKAAVVLDAGVRTNGVYDTHQEGGDWMREASIQMTGFGLGGAAGGLTAKGAIRVGSSLAVRAGVVKAGFMSAGFLKAGGLLAAGPVGWAAFGVIVGVSVIVAFQAGKYGDRFGKFIASSIMGRNMGEVITISNAGQGAAVSGTGSMIGRGGAAGANGGAFIGSAFGGAR